MQIELKDVSYSYKKNYKENYKENKSDSKKFSLNHVTFTVQQGFITGLVGVNGAGKTTIFNMLMNIHTDYTGQILLNGADIKEADTNTMENRMKIGFISEDQNFINSRTMLENARLRGVFYDDFSENVFKEKMEEVKLPFVRQFGTASRGEKIKFQLAFALSHHADILLIDEGTAGMDPVFRKDFFRILHTYMENEEHAVLISTHNEEEIKRHMDYVVYLENGNARCVEQG